MPGQNKSPARFRLTPFCGGQEAPAQPDTGYGEFQLFLPKSGAGEGNRTLVVSLGSFCSTIELHPHFRGLAAFCTSGLQLVLHSAVCLPQWRSAGQRRDHEFGDNLTTLGRSTNPLRGIGAYGGLTHKARYRGAVVPCRIRADHLCFIDRTSPRLVIQI